mmetsp:Transcript_40091/g.72673  ORF Transcript_40091/g.72673 Transcript_40091/m.72673 type:complete len:168 (-) Transcript_40091:121-624(-)
MFTCCCSSKEDVGQSHTALGPSEGVQSLAEPQTLLDLSTAPRAATETPLKKFEEPLKLQYNFAEEPDEFQIYVEPRGRKMGVELAHGSGPEEGVVRINGIKPEGVVAEWNLRHPERQVVSNSYITALNDIPVDAMTVEGIRRVFATANELRIKVSLSKPPRLTPDDS